MARRRVLIVDDDVWLVAQFSRSLRQAGYDVFHARNGLDGMQQIDDHRPAAIILDIFMPGPNGLVLLHELRSHSDLAKIPVIVCTNSAADASEDTLRHYGVTRVLDKTTMVPEDIVAAVKAVL